MPDEEVMILLERKRGRGRDDYPVRAMWNSILAGIVYQHDSVEKLRRELARNGQLREMCGFDGQVPPPWVYTRFMKSLLEQETAIDNMFEKLVQQLKEVLPDFGKHLAIDSKAISSFANHKSKKNTPDGRRDTDADYGRKEYRGVHEDGRAWEKIVKWFGYKLHLVVDATYELPVLFTITKASEPDINEAHRLMEQLEDKQPDIVKLAETIAGDKGYDDTKLIKTCWVNHQIKPIIALISETCGKTKIKPVYSKVKKM